MRKFFLAVGVSSLSLASVFSVQAADAVRRQYHNHGHSRPVVPTHINRNVISYQDWSGSYLGLAGKGMINNKYSYSIGPSAFAGFNLQNGPFVYGVDSDLSYLFDVKNDVLTSEKTKSEMIGPSGSLSARFGYEVFDPVLAYVSGGLSVASEVHAKSAGDSTKEYSLAIGPTLGAGVDVMLLDGVSARVGYNFGYYNNTANEDNGYQHSISVGLAMKL
ncbi:Opacity protein [Candidatus Liberibacter americanus str. Sao Paulo]|uniref:Opacity protein n=2 Tax=Candidatus Liberibacter americanus TaxID=309868 RepID=U6B910_9HYPH|nr:Opacity protein [Candidatus Liberibacter americanus str. Sao Paulo]